MKILLLGKNGQVGWELQRSLAPLGEVVALDSTARAAGGRLRATPTRSPRRCARSRRDVIVNAAAHTAVDQAETRARARARASTPTRPACWRARPRALGAWLVHYSTDYVFDGSGSAPWTEDAPTGAARASTAAPSSKAKQLIRASGCRHLILRTSWVYAARGGNFAKTMLRAGARARPAARRSTTRSARRPAPSCSPTSPRMRCARAHAEPELAGTYHAVAAGETSWHGYARHVDRVARAAATADQGRATTRSRRSRAAAYPTPARAAAEFAPRHDASCATRSASRCRPGRRASTACSTEVLTAKDAA